MEIPSKRIPALDGLRGLAILLVVVGHAVSLKRSIPVLWHRLISSEVGVLLFFTLSGYLITSLLAHEKAQFGKVNWKHFLIKRAAKLGPSLLLLVAVTYVLSRYRGNSCQAHSYAVALLFLTEIWSARCWRLGHTWSLSVEEIFYLTWLPAVTRLSTATLGKILIAVIVAAPAVRAYNYLVTGRSFLHALPPIPFFPWADSLAFGALAALVALEKPPKMGPRNFASAITLLLGLGYLFRMPLFKAGSISWLKYLTPLGPTAFGAGVGLLLLALAHSDGMPLVRRFLSLAPLRALGKASYSIYLWQQIFTDRAFQLPVANGLVAGIFLRVGLAIAVGCLLFHAYEQPLNLFLRRFGLRKSPSPRTKGDLPPAFSAPHNESFDSAFLRKN